MMRILTLALVMTTAIPAATTAQVLTAPPAATVAGPYTTAGTDLGTLLDDPAAKAVLDKHIPQIVGNEQIAMARGMTLKAVQQYAGDTLTDEVLKQIDADLAKLPAKK